MNKVSLPPQIDGAGHRVRDNGYHAIRFNNYISYRLITDTIDKYEKTLLYGVRLLGVCPLD